VTYLYVETCTFARLFWTSEQDPTKDRTTEPYISYITSGNLTVSQ